MRRFSFSLLCFGTCVRYLFLWVVRCNICFLYCGPGSCLISTLIYLLSGNWPRFVMAVKLSKHLSLHAGSSGAHAQSITEFSPLYIPLGLEDEARRMDVVLVAMPREYIRSSHLELTLHISPAKSKSLRLTQRVVQVNRRHYDDVQE